jgi:hypothetical protein
MSPLLPSLLLLMQWVKFYRLWWLCRAGRLSNRLRLSICFDMYISLFHFSLEFPFVVVWFLTVFFSLRITLLFRLCFSATLSSSLSINDVVDFQSIV